MSTRHESPLEHDEFFEIVVLVDKKTNDVHFEINDVGSINTNDRIANFYGIIHETPMGALMLKHIMERAEDSDDPEQSKYIEIFENINTLLINMGLESQLPIIRPQEVFSIE